MSGFVCQRFTHRVSIVIGGMVLSAGLLASAFANSILHLYLTCGLVAGKSNNITFIFFDVCVCGWVCACACARVCVCVPAKIITKWV